MSEQSSQVFAGVDVGGTSIKIGLVNGLAESLAFEAIPTLQEEGPLQAAKRSAETIHRLAQQAGIDQRAILGVGLATPGPMDIPAGMLVCPGNLPAWHNTPIRDRYAEAIGMPVSFENDANAAAFGEYWAGVGKDYNSLVLFTLGTGVGGGIVLGNNSTSEANSQPLIINGEHSVGAELGHVIIDPRPDAALNTLGTRGTLEAYCGSYGVKNQVMTLLEDPANKTTLRDRIEAGESFTPKMVSEEAEAGDPLAMQVILDTAFYLSLGIVTAVHTIDPQIVAIGGSLTFGGSGHPLGEKFLAKVREETNLRLMPNIRNKIAIEFAHFGGSAGYIGAAGLARRDYLLA